MSLAQTCTQCRYEALPYFWQNTVFYLLYSSMRSLMRHTSQSLREQIKVVYLGVDLEWKLQLSPGNYWGAFTGVQKIIVVHFDIGIISRERLCVRLKGIFGKDAEVVSP
jgi:hypothetical protein